MNRLIGTRLKLFVCMLAMTLIVQSFGLLFGTHKVQAASTAQDLQLNVKAAILMDAETGQVLYGMNQDTLRRPASMAKMMTEYIAMEKIKSGALKWSTQVTVSPYAAAVIGSGQLLAAGETYTIEDVFKAISIYSSNDAAVTLAETISGTEENFAKLMNKTAQRLGLSKSAHFINATGLDRSDMGDHAPQSIEGETELTARDTATIAYHIVNEHPESLQYTSKPREYLRPGDENSLMENWNWMLEGWKTYNNNFSSFAYQGMDGLKTGHTDAAGFCFTGTAKRGDTRLISVVMGATTRPNSFVETKKVMDYGFNNFEKKTVVKAKASLKQLSKVSVTKGKDTEIELVTEKPVQFVVKKGTSAKDFTIKAVSVEKSERVAPIKKGEVLGTATVTYQNIEKKVNLVAKNDVEKASWFRLLMRSIGNLFKDIISGIKSLF